ncbi:MULTISPECIES: DUF1778 domain-containing protein [unclassified Caballeronia]|uniref:type II toxin-antitoxin system TacA family antitoxin n=1 Tax=unclassified Caballeronia TaxID=2646786 RepID=UPI0019CFCE07|nr:MULTISPECIES: DUF1778 domain-containing protein [unclassified Caballeronia]
MMLPTETHKPVKAARTDRIDARLSGELKDLLEHAAALQGSSVTAFVLASAEEAALKTIKDHETIRLSERDREAFVAALLNPPLPSERLRSAAAAYLKETGPA